MILQNCFELKIW